MNENPCEIYKAMKTFDVSLLSLERLGMEG